MKHIFKYIFITSLLAQSLFPSNENQFTKIFKNLTLKLKDTFKNPRNNKKTALAIGYGLFCVLNNSWRLRKGNEEQIKIGKQTTIQSYKGKWNWINYVDLGYLLEYGYKNFKSYLDVHQNLGSLQKCERIKKQKSSQNIESSQNMESMES